MCIWEVVKGWDGGRRTDGGREGGSVGACGRVEEESDVVRVGGMCTEALNNLCAVLQKFFPPQAQHSLQRGVSDIPNFAKVREQPILDRGFTEFLQRFPLQPAFW